MKLSDEELSRVLSEAHEGSCVQPDFCMKGTSSLWVELRLMRAGLQTNMGRWAETNCRDTYDDLLRALEKMGLA